MAKQMLLPKLPNERDWEKYKQMIDLFILLILSFVKVLHGFECY